MIKYDYMQIKGRKGGRFMFQVGEYIVCDHNGVCRILDIAEMPELKKGVLYYELEPVYSIGSRIYVPVDSEKLVMRKVLEPEDVKGLLEKIPFVNMIWISNEKKREDQYRESARKYDCLEWVRIIKTIYERKRDRRLAGKKVTYIDEKYMKMAEANLYGEMSVVLHISPEQAAQMVRKKIKDQKLTEIKNNV